MKVVMLAGGLGTRLSEETILKPKPMIEIGGMPILWHIMNIYAAHGFNEFIIALGYKGEIIKDFFLNYYNFQSDLTVSLKTGDVIASKNCYRDWLIHMVDTGQNTMTGGRLHRLANKLNDDDTFMLTYGDGVSDINIKDLLKFHVSHGKAATVAAVRPAARFGGLVINDEYVKDFKEKPQMGEGWINGGFFIFQKKVLEYLHGDNTILEKDPLERLAKEGQLVAYQHEGFWQCMDTIRDKQLLEKLWEGGSAPWKV